MRLITIAITMKTKGPEKLVMLNAFSIERFNRSESLGPKNIILNHTFLAEKLLTITIYDLKSKHLPLMQLLVDLPRTCYLVLRQESYLSLLEIHPTEDIDDVLSKDVLEPKCSILTSPTKDIYPFFRYAFFYILQTWTSVLLQRKNKHYFIRS